LEDGGRRFVLDNTYASRRTRAAVLQAAARHGAAVRCIWLDTSLEDAQVNACERMLATHGRLLGPEELGRGDDAGAIPPAAQFRYRREFEPPAADEGFAAIEIERFVRRPDPARTASGLILDLDEVVWRGRTGARAPSDPLDLDLVPGRAERIRELAARGLRLGAVTWLPGLGPEAISACADALRHRLGIDLPIVACPHPAGPPICWCRKPVPGLGVMLLVKLELDPARTVHVGCRPLDRTFAARLGLGYAEADEFFAPAG
jgi:hypothetical protein